VSQDLLRHLHRPCSSTPSASRRRRHPDATFEALGLDSLDVVELTLVLEEETGVKLEDEELEDVRTVQDAIDKVAAKKQQAA
jgi:acyl carrier protein